MKYSLRVTAFCLFLSLTASAQIKVDLPDKTFTQFELCRKKYCRPGNKGTPHALKEPHDIDISDVTDEKTAVLQVIGRTTDMDDFLLDTLRPCSDTGEHPFTDAHISKSGIGLTKINYTTNRLFVIGAEGRAEINQKVSQAVTNAATLVDIKSKLEAEFKKLNNQLLTIEGEYTEWTLNRRTLDLLGADNGFNGCKRFLTKNNRRIVTAVGLVRLDIKVGGINLNNVAGGFQSILAAAGIDANIGFIIKREVLKTINAETGNIYVIPFFRHAEASEL